MAAVKNIQIEPGFEPIEGYVLEERIGQGGFGEVWRATAPGGLKKAVKFVYGKHGERHAAQELKSLERIRGIQHPFILTLERFEFIDNQLVIVTELAEGTLEDLFNQHRKRGSCGIPREALLGYLRDAADALDYLHQHYQLQHLDIKPGNLLIVGGRVKVADFGLLKDLGEIDCSMVGGLTPIYAPPELFDGRPTLHSDQYSLAVMYQEMLTNSRPFNGRTIAQLATQHVHNSPNLSPLPASDRPTVARALEKSPDRRFESCAAFIDKLANPHGATEMPTEKLDVDEGQSSEVIDLPQLSEHVVRDHDAPTTHALVVALGGTGTDILNQVRRRVFDFGAASPLTLHSVLIDTDIVGTQAAQMIDPTDQVARTRVVPARLRSANDYRASGTGRFASISRRWIYNVPRNGQTSGMRPLGRLALVDHGHEVVEQLTAAIRELKQSASGGEQTKVYVVASLTGGTGGGMYFDVAYLLRHLLDEQALENVAIVSLLTTNRFQGDPSKPLALHATKSALTEFDYFLKPGNSYPGDSGGGWPSVPAARTPLHNAYIIAPSDRSTERRALDSAVNYLWADATIGNESFEKGRHIESISSLATCLRTVGVVQLGEPIDHQAMVLGPANARQLLRCWVGDDQASISAAGISAAGEFSRRIIRRCYLTDEVLRSIPEKWIASDKNDLRQLVKEQLVHLEPVVLSDRGTVEAHLVRWLSTFVDLDQIQVIVEQAIQQIDRELRIHLLDQRLNLSSALSAVKALQVHCSDIRSRLYQHGQQQQSDNQTDQSGNASRKRLVALEEACLAGEQLVESVAARVASDIASKIEKGLGRISETIQAAIEAIEFGITQLSDDNSGEVDPWLHLESHASSQKDKFFDRLHERCASNYLLRLIDPGRAAQLGSWVTDFSGELTEKTREFLVECESNEARDCNSLEHQTTTAFASPVDDSVAGTTKIRDGLAGGGSDSTGISKTQSWAAGNVPEVLSVTAAIEAARPVLLECGGKQRHYLICRNQSEREQLVSQLPEEIQSSVSVIISRKATPMLIHEGQQIDVGNVLRWLDSLTGDDGKISRRLATRCDIEW